MKRRSPAVLAHLVAVLKSKMLCAERPSNGGQAQAKERRNGERVARRPNPRPAGR
mgnify:CR=1 FL=1